MSSLSEQIYAELASPEEVAEMLGGVEPTDDIDWPEALPLRREMPEGDRYPTDVLPGVLKGAATRMQESIQAPLALIGQSILGGAVLAVQGHANVSIDGRRFPLSLFLGTIAESGERKTACDNTALAPHRKREKDLRDELGPAHADFEAEHAAWKKAREEALSASKNKTREAKAQAIKALGPEPLAPIDPMMIAQEPTYEGLVKSLADGWPSMGLFSDEGGQFLGGHAMNADNLVKTATGLSDLWQGNPIRRTRSGDGSFVLYGRRVSLHLMFQPILLDLLFGNAILGGQGFNARILATYPASTIGTRLYRAIDLNQDPVMLRYFARVMQILESPLPWEDPQDLRRGLKQREIVLSSDAMSLWVLFHDHMERLSAPGAALEPIKAHAAKAAEQAARLAGILALTENLDTGVINKPALEAGIELVQFYIGEALRLHQGRADDPDIVLAEKVLAWGRARGGRFGATELYQFGPNAIRDKQTALRILNLLADHGLARTLPDRCIIDGKSYRHAWEVRP